MRVLFIISSVFLSATFLILIFPGFEMHYLAWIALVPLLIVIRQAGPLGACLSSMAASLVFNFGLQWWVLKIESFNLLHFSITLVGVALYFGLFGYLAHYFHNKYPKWNVLTFPSVWVALEFLRSHVGFLSWPWGILGYSQYSVIPVIQVAAFTGVYGVSFLIVAVNTVIAEITESILSSRLSIPQGILGTISLRRSLFLLAAAVLAVFALSVFSGSLSWRDAKRFPSLKGALVQGNVYWDDRYWTDKYKFDATYREGIFQKYSDQTLRAAESKPDLILWPSSSVPGRIPYDWQRFKMLSELAQQTGNFLLIGSSGFDKFSRDKRKKKRVANSAFLFSPEGRNIGRYDKIRLLPFDEYLPMREYLKWPSWIISDITDHEPGNELTIFNMNGTTFGVLICWEYMFPDQFREMSSKGVDFMVNMTNEGFTRVPAAHYQMTAMSVLRAVENHVAIARTASTGVSCIIEPNGRIVGRVKDEAGRDVDVEGYLVGQIPLTSERSFYNRYGDWFIYIISLLVIGMIVWNELVRKYFLK